MAHPLRTGRPNRRGPLAVVALLSLFATLVVVGGRLNDGYLHGRDYVSSLAAYGAEAAWVGVLAIATFAAAHAVAALVVAAGPRAGAVPALLLACAGTGVVSALARITCPGGAAGCATGSADAGGLSDAVHGAAVAAYAVLVVLSMAAFVPSALRRGLPGVGFTAVVLGLLSAIAALQVEGTAPGGWQRAWLAVNGGWLVLAAAVARVPAGGRGTRRR